MNKHELVADSLKRSMERYSILSKDKLIPKQWREKYKENIQGLVELIAQLGDKK